MSERFVGHERQKGCSGGTSRTRTGKRDQTYNVHLRKVPRIRSMKHVAKKNPPWPLNSDSESYEVPSSAHPLLWSHSIPQITKIPGLKSWYYKCIIQGRQLQGSQGGTFASSCGYAGRPKSGPPNRSKHLKGRGEFLQIGVSIWDTGNKILAHP